MTSMCVVCANGEEPVCCLVGGRVRLGGPLNGAGVRLGGGIAVGGIAVGMRSALGVSLTRVAIITRVADLHA